ncbi:MAG: glycosyltransferase [Pseudomonadota bacterium]
MPDPTFAISVPIGSWHPFLAFALESLICQNVALNVAVLDASGDARVEDLVDRVSPRFGVRLAYRRHGPDGGQSDAICEGWNNIDGEVLGWLNADDILFPNALQHAVDAFAADPKLDVVYGHSSILNDEGAMTGFHWAVEPPGPRLLESGIISQPSCFFRRKPTDDVGGVDKALHYTMDWDLWLRLYASGARFGFIDEPLSMVLWGADTKTASFNKRRQDELKRLIKTYAPEERQRKIFRSFAIQNTLDRIRPAALQSLAVRTFVRGRKVVYGLSADGLIREKSLVPLAHYQAEAPDVIDIHVSDSANVSCVLVDGAPVELTRLNKTTLRCEPTTRIEAGRTVQVVIKAGKHPVQLRKVALTSHER